MSNYRRLRIPGGCWFFTVVVADRGSDLLIRHVDVLREAVRTVRRARPFRIDAFVVLPDHLHAVWTLPADDDDFPTRWRLIKKTVSLGLPKEEPRSPSRIRRGERGIWQRRYWEHAIRDDGDFAAHVDYVHFNPVKHGFVVDPSGWPYSTVHRHVRAGDRPPG